MKHIQHILNLVRHKELLKKEKNLNLENKSLLIENKDEFLEFLSYYSILQNFISYQNKEKYYSLISQYLDNLIPPQLFQSEFLELEQKDAEAAEIFLNDRKESETFSIDLIEIKFGSMVDKIAELSEIASEFGPQTVISNENFLKLIKKIYSEIYSEIVALEIQSEEM